MLYVRRCGIHLILNIAQFGLRYIMFSLLQKPRTDEGVRLFLYALSTSIELRVPEMKMHHQYYDHVAPPV